MIINRYVTREISRPFLIIISICAVIFASFTTAVILNEVVSGLIPATTVAKLVFIRLVIALEILIPVALYFGIVFGLGRMHADSEIVALSAGGLGEVRLAGIILRFSLVVALVVACISLFARPWAYQQQYQLRAQVAAEFDIGYLEARQLLVNPGSNYAIFAATVDRPARSAGEVIVQIRKSDAMQIITGKRLFQPPREEGAPPVFTFEDGYVYKLDMQGSNDVIGKFGTLNLTLAPPEPVVIGYKSKAAGLLTLFETKHRKDLAELQWRLSTPVATVLIALLAIPLSRSGPRRGRSAKALAAVAAYAVFFNLMTFAKNLVQEGLIGAVPGLWWPLLMLGVLLAVLFHRPSGFSRT